MKCWINEKKDIGISGKYYRYYELTFGDFNDNNYLHNDIVIIHLNYFFKFVIIENNELCLIRQELDGLNEQRFPLKKIDETTYSFLKAEDIYDILKDVSYSFAYEIGVIDSFIRKRNPKRAKKKAKEIKNEKIFKKN